jgi:hypothetical protein
MDNSFQFDIAIDRVWGRFIGRLQLLLLESSFLVDDRQRGPLVLQNVLNGSRTFLKVAR